MHNLIELKKQQVGLRLPKYLVDDIDEFTRNFSVNRTDIIVEAVRAYVADQKAELFYSEFDNSCKELKDILENKTGKKELQTLENCIDEIEHC